MPGEIEPSALPYRSPPAGGTLVLPAPWMRGRIERGIRKWIEWLHLGKALGARVHASHAGFLGPARLWDRSARFLVRIRGLFKAPDFHPLFQELRADERLLWKYAHKRLAHSRVVEIGRGARPWRLFVLSSLGADAYGVDLGQPVLGGSLQEFSEIRRRDRARRFLKSFVRHHVLDWRKRRHLDRALQAQGLALKLNPTRFLLADADAEFSETIPAASVDLIYCLDVFEHWSSSALEEIVRRMHMWLKPSGLALVRLRLHTGIRGGHLAEWRSSLVGKRFDRKSEPREHLRKNRVQAKIVLNRLRMRDYVRVLRRRFEILECVRPNLGLSADYLSPDFERELSAYSRNELLTNEVFLVLRRVYPRRVGDVTCSRAGGGSGAGREEHVGTA
jgi:hypothetical protein